MNYNFKKFEGRNKRQDDRISVTKSNSLGFPTKFYKDNKLESYKSAVLFWDNENKAIGILPTNDVNEKNGFTIIRSQNYGGQIIATSFFKENNIDLNLYHGKYLPEKHTEEGIGDMWVIKLQENKK